MKNIWKENIHENLFYIRKFKLPFLFIYFLKTYISKSKNYKNGWVESDNFRIILLFECHFFIFLIHNFVIMTSIYTSFP